MPRPRKMRQICHMPTYTDFGPKSRVEPKEEVHMTVDEFESIRLIDYEDLTQEECASQMNIARSSVQHIYNSARQKVALMIVTGAPMSISGGSYYLCDDSRVPGCGKCRKNRRGRGFRNEEDLQTNRRVKHESIDSY